MVADGSSDFPEEAAHQTETEIVISDSPETDKLQEHLNLHAQAKKHIEHPAKGVCAPPFTGKSARTLRRWEKAQKDLAAKGFHSIPEFFKWKAEQVAQKAKVNTIIATVKARHEARVNAEEEEGSSKEEMIPRVMECDSRSVDEMEEDSDMRCAASPVWGQVCVPTSACRLSNQVPSTLEVFWKAVPVIEEESEEESSCSEMVKNGEDTEAQSNPEDIQEILKKMLEDLHHRNSYVGSGLQQSVDNPLELLQNHAALQATQNELARIARCQPLSGTLRSWVLAMTGLLNVFLKENTTHTWTEASVLVAHSQGHGIARARAIRKWVLDFALTQQLPVPQYHWTQSSVLDDEDISQAIQLELSERVKSGTLSATDLIDVVSKPGIQAQFAQHSRAFRTLWNTLECPEHLPSLTDGLGLISLQFPSEQPIAG